MTRTRFAPLLLIPLAFLLMGAAVLVDPEPIPVPAKLAAKDVSKAIRSGIVARGWVIAKDEKGQIDAVLNVRKHEVRVAIQYDTQQVKINYVSSQNLDYEEKGGTRRIHKKYNQWAQNMATDIRTSLAAEAISRE
jgi:hypothetical protein